MYTLEVISLQKTRAIHGTVLLEVGKGSDIVAKEDNLVSLADRTKEEQREIARMGGIASGEARRENAIMRKTLEKMLNATYEDKGTYKDNVALGLLANAIDKSKGGNPEAYKVIAKMLGELDTNEEPKETPSVTINVVNNEELEKYMYESDK